MPIVRVPIARGLGMAADHLLSDIWRQR